MIILIILLGLLVVIQAYKENNIESSQPISKIPKEKSRALLKAERLAKEFKEGTRVYAKKEDGNWYKGTSLGYHDWGLYTTFFLVEFEDGDILSLPSEDIQKIISH